MSDASWLGDVQDVRDPDELLAARLRGGDRIAFAALTARYWKAVHRITGSMLPARSDAAGAAEGTFLVVLRCAASLPSSEPFRTWLYRIAVDQSLLRLQESPQRVAGSARGDLADRIRDALGQVEHLDRASFALHVVEELSAEEVGAILLMAPDEIRRRTHRTVLALIAGLSQLREARHAWRLCIPRFVDRLARILPASPKCFSSRVDRASLPEPSGRATPSR